MILRNGNSLESFLKTIELLDKNTMCKRLLRKGNTINITGQIDYENNKAVLTNYNISYPENQFLKNTFKGKKLDINKFFKDLKGKETIKGLDCFSVLALSSTENEIYQKKGIEYIKSNWIKIDTLEPFDLDQEGRPIMNMLHFPIRKDELFLFSTGICFYDEVENEIFPIQEEAIASICRMLDAYWISKDDYPLGRALIIANKVAKFSENGVNMLIKNKRGNIYPVVSLFSRKYEYIPNKEVFSTILDAIAKHGVYKVEDWKISNSLNEKEMTISLLIPNIVIVIRNADIGRAIEVAAYYVLDNKSKILIKSNTFGHSKAWEKQGIESLINDVFWESIDEFITKLNSDKIVTITEKTIKEIRKIIGSKRDTSKNLSSCIGYSGTYKQCLEELTNKSYFEEFTERLAPVYSKIA